MWGNAWGSAQKGSHEKPMHVETQEQACLKTQHGETYKRLCEVCSTDGEHVQNLAFPQYGGLRSQD
eukprot:1138036-Pelagomonas_calceolata.AAC.2